jgi:hypothetical protein
MQRQHGHYLTYLRQSCRCRPCLDAWAAYSRERRRKRALGEYSHVSAEPSRRHILRLSRAGVGEKSLAAASGVGRSAIRRIRCGAQLTVTPRTESRLLAVTKEAYGDGANLPAGPTLRLIERLLKEGFTKVELAKRISPRTSVKPALNIGKSGRVKARTAMQVERFYNRLMARA